MKRLLIGFFALLLAVPALAERKQSHGEYDVHYSAFPSGFLQPDIAAAYQLVRSKTQGVVNISVLKGGKPVPAQVSGTVKNLLGQDQPLAFRQVREGNAIYSLAQFPIDGEETLRFSINVQPAEGGSINLQFNQQVVPQ